MPRLKTNRREPHQCFHQSTQRGEGVGDVAKWILNKGKRGLLFARRNAADIAKLAAVALKLYQGNTSSLKDALTTSMDLFGMSELEALKRVIIDKKEGKITPKAPPVAPVIAPQPSLPVAPKRAPVRAAAPVSNDLLSQIKAGKPLRTRAPPIREVPQNNSLAQMLDAIRARRRMINPDDDENEQQQGVGAKTILLQIAQHHLKNKVNRDKTLPESKQHVVGKGKISNVLGGISTISGAVSTIPGPHEIVTVPLTVISGIASGIAKMFGGSMCGRGKGSVKSIKKIIFDRLISARKDIADGGYQPSLKQLSKEIVVDVIGKPSKMIETKVRSMLGNGLKIPGSGRKISGSGLLDISLSFLTKKALPSILKRMGLNLTPRDLDEVQKMVKQIVGDAPLTIKRAIEIAKELTPHLYRLFRGKMAGTGLILPGGQKKFTAKLAREIINS